MLLNCKHFTIPLYIAMVATVIHPYGCINTRGYLHFINCSTVNCCINIISYTLNACNVFT